MTVILIILLACLAVLLSKLFYLSVSKFDYWKKRNVPHLKPIPLFGNYKDYIVLKKVIPEVVRDICRKFPNEPYIGAFYGTEPTLIVQDPEYIKLILTKDFYYFNGREASGHSNSEILTKNLFFTSGDRWKIIRQNLTPLFSSAKMKKMFYLIEECSIVFEKLLEDAVQLPSVEVRSMMAGYTIDCIGSCAFGINMKAMSAEDNPFREIGQKIFEASDSRGLKNIGRAVWPAIFYKLGFQLFPGEITNFFESLLTKVFEQRQYKDSGRQDFVDLILSLKQNRYISGDCIKNMKGERKKTILEVDNDFLCSQCTVFFAAGYETSSTTLSFLLFELAKNPEKQNRAIEEVDQYFRKYDKLIYDCVTETPYLDACINETLRLYPVLGVITREVLEDYTLPSGVSLSKGVRVHIPVYHLHKNPEFFPNPNAFCPERFLGAEKENIKPFTYMPFGEGPRICIGMRFAKMQMTAGLLTILKNCRVDLAKNTPLVVDLQPRALTTQPMRGINLKFISRTVVNSNETSK